jgi:signal transduction histidine kinase
VAASRVKDVFLATMSHELRTPLNSIIGFSDLMLNGISGPLSPEQLRQVTIVNKSGHHLLGLISDVLDISKVEAGQMPLQIESLILREMFEEQRQAFDMPARERGLELRIELPDPTVCVRADAKRARQVISNLVSNAVKYTDRGCVSLRAELDGAMVRIAVEDTGIGIPAEELPGMFQPFHRIQAPKGVIRDGTGLGLAIARRLVTAMNGEIGVESEPGKGSRFWFTLPRA